jgi:hypothetical protein
MQNLIDLVTNIVDRLGNPDWWTTRKTVIAAAVVLFVVVLLMSGCSTYQTYKLGDSGWSFRFGIHQSEKE